jgi:DNA-binding XRE family transcriptional regulator
MGDCQECFILSFQTLLDNVRCRWWLILIVQTKFGERFKQLREEANLTMEQLAASLGTKKQTISRYENNQREPEYATLIKIAQFFNVSTDYLLGLKDYK